MVGSKSESELIYVLFFKKKKHHLVVGIHILHMCLMRGATPNPVEVISYYTIHRLYFLSKV